MKAYILSIAGAVLLSAVITVIAPGGRMGKFLRGAVNLVILVVMAAPLTALFRGEGEMLGAGSIAYDEGYLAYCAETLSAEDEAALCVFLQEEYGVTARAQVVRRAEAGFAYEKIYVEILDFGIIGQDEHIYMTEQIESALEECYGCAAEVS